MFKIGDAVRVKAGSPKYSADTLDIFRPYHDSFGHKYVVSYVGVFNCVPCCVLHGEPAIDVKYLEPWNDSEEWNGDMWILKMTHNDA